MTYWFQTQVLRTKRFGGYKTHHLCLNRLMELGMIRCLLTDSDIDDFTGIIATRTAQIIMEIIDSKTGENHE